MAGFEKKNWINRQSQYPNRRKLVETEFENTYEIERAEGEVTEPGNAFDADNMNELETRIANAFSTLEDKDIKITDESNIFTETTLDKVLTEIFMYAVNGKTLIANAIGGVANSSTFKQIADRITAGKTAIVKALRSNNTTVNNTLEQMAEEVVKRKKYYKGKINITKNYVGEITSTPTIIHVDVDFGFLPEEVFVNGVDLAAYKAGYDKPAYYVDTTIKSKEKPTDFVSTGASIANITEDGFDIELKTSSSLKTLAYVIRAYAIIYAIG